MPFCLYDLFRTCHYERLFEVEISPKNTYLSAPPLRPSPTAGINPAGISVFGNRGIAARAQAYPQGCSRHSVQQLACIQECSLLSVRHSLGNCRSLYYLTSSLILIIHFHLSFASVGITFQEPSTASTTSSLDCRP